jgi:hypothetical protein
VCRRSFREVQFPFASGQRYGFVKLSSLRQCAHHALRGLHHVYPHGAKISQYINRKGCGNLCPYATPHTQHQIHIQEELNTSQLYRGQLDSYFRGSSGKGGCSCVFKRSREPRGIDFIPRAHKLPNTGERWFACAWNG